MTERDLVIDGLVLREIISIADEVIAEDGPRAGISLRLLLDSIQSLRDAYEGGSL